MNNDAGFISSEVDGSTTNEIQTIDVLQLSGTTLEVSLSSDSPPNQTVDLSPLQDGTGTDDQILSVDSSGYSVQINIEDGNTINFGLQDADSDPANENQTVSAGTGISVNQVGQDFEVTNTNPDQTVVINSGAGVNVSGTYPNFTVTNTGDTNASDDFSGAWGDLAGVPAGFADDIDNVDDADADPANDFKPMSIPDPLLTPIL